LELVYLWVEDYKNIKRQGFNFSPRFECKFDGETLTITKKEDEYIKDFFGENINVTAIIGENGSGKSTVLELLFNKYDHTTLKKGLFFLYFDKDAEEDKKLIFLGANETKINDSEYKIKMQSKMETLPSTKTVYFSNILNENDLFLPTFIIDAHHTHSINISTTHRLSQMKLIETSSMQTSVTSFDKIYRSYRIQQILNSLILIKDNAIEIPFVLPKTISIKNIDFRTYLRTIRDKFTDDNYSYRKIIEILDRNNTDTGLFKNYLSINLIISFLLENIDFNNPFRERLLEEILGGKLDTTKLEDFYNNVKERVYAKEWYIHGQLEQSNSIIDFFDLADKLRSQINSLQLSEVDNKFEIELTVKNTDFSFLETYEKLIQQSEYFWDIGFDRGLSSGEENYLYQFARFHQLSKGFKDNPHLNLNINNQEAKNLIFLIDEGEDTMHPRWQKKYINYLTKFFSKNFKQNIHLIITSHSPFIVSDLPKGNILFMKDAKEDEEGVHKQTFGANIHTLLSDGFFMDKKGLVGEFAQNKIQDVINFLKDEKSEINSANEAKKIIDIIGEPFLKMQIEDLYKKKFPETLKLDEQIEKLKQELERLENAKNRG